MQDSSRMFVARFAWLVGLTACGTTPQANVASASAAQSQPIVGGQVTTSYPAVGVLLNFAADGGGGGQLCTASIISPNRILTAAHCVLAQSTQNGDLPSLADPGDVFFYLGNSLSGTIQDNLVFGAVAIHLPGGAAFPFQQFVGNLHAGNLNSDDLAVIDLDANTGVAPLYLSNGQLTPAVIGLPVTLVGYGATRMQDGVGSGVKRTVTAAITAYNDAFIQAGDAQHATCSGDSGGPVLYRNVIIGVTQAGQVDASGACVGGDIFTRVDRALSFILNAP